MSNQTVAIIPARGGSKGIRKKNLLPFCGKPLIAWTIIQCNESNCIDQVWVTTDDPDIASVAESYSASIVWRPPELASDEASSESAWIHATEVIERTSGPINTLVLLQATSPIRNPDTLDKAIGYFKGSGYDSLFSANTFEDFFAWSYNSEIGSFVPINYDPNNRKRRQELPLNYHENGSFYITTPSSLISAQNRLNGTVGAFVCKDHELFQIDSQSDVAIAEAIFSRFILHKAV